jgi:hypothetical protein
MVLATKERLYYHMNTRGNSFARHCVSHTKAFNSVVPPMCIDIDILYIHALNTHSAFLKEANPRNMPKFEVVHYSNIKIKHILTIPVLIYPTNKVPKSTV